MTALQLLIFSIQIQFHAALSVLITAFGAVRPSYTNILLYFDTLFFSVHLMGCKCLMLVAWSHSCSRGWVTRCSLLLCRDNLLPSLPCVYPSLPPSLCRVCCLETELTLPFRSPPPFHSSPLKASFFILLALLSMPRCLRMGI